MRESNPRHRLKRPLHYHYANQVVEMVGLEPTSFICKTNILPVKLHSQPFYITLQPIGFEPIPIISKTTALPIKLGFFCSRTNFRQHDLVTTQHPLRTVTSLSIKYKLFIKMNKIIFLFLLIHQKLIPINAIPISSRRLTGSLYTNQKKFTVLL